jgi:16S rRNA (guanine527-N7)-methyltransferase
VSFADLEPLLVAGAERMGVELDARQSGLLITLIGEVAEWNGRFNLTAIRDPEEMVRKHLLDSLSIHAFLRGTTVADIGTGAGFPGLPLAVVNPGRRFTLVDSTAKKCRFVEHAAARLGLTNVTVVNARAEVWRPQAPFDVVVSRALGKVSEFIRVAGHLCAPQGRLLAMKGKHPEAELDALPRGWRIAAVHRVDVPGLDAERHVVELARSAQGAAGGR